MLDDGAAGADGVDALAPLEGVLGVDEGVALALASAFLLAPLLE